VHIKIPNYSPSNIVVPKTHPSISTTINMNIIIIKDKLKEGLDAVTRAVGDHPTLPILKNIFIQAKDGIINLTSTNLEIGLRHGVSGKISKDGEITVPANILSQIISNLSDERVELSMDGSILNISTDSYKAGIQGSPADEFPALPEMENLDQYIEMESVALKSALSSVLSAAQFSELRPELSSVFFQFLGDRLVLAATDSFRLAEKTIGDNQFKSTIEGEFNVLLPLRTGQELVRTLKDKGMVKIYRDPNQILFKTEEMEFISRLLEGTFPDYRAIIPKEYQAEVFVDRDELLGAIKLAGVMSGASSEAALRPAKDGSLEVFSRDERLGENSCLVAAKIQGTLKEASFNWKYLQEGAKTMPAKEMVLGLNDDNKPAIIRSRQDPSYFYILMPILKG
jgi:DNA polymerase-3 subunit beta